MDNEGWYCKLNIGKCDTCLKSNPFNSFMKYESINIWREKWGQLLSGCDKVIVFSNDSKNIIKNIYNTLDNIEIIPHVVDYIVPIKKNIKKNKSIKIGILGVLAHHKGLDVIKDMLRIIDEFKLNIKFVLIGSSDEKIEHKSFIETGKYSVDKISKLVIEHEIDIIFIPSIWPETYSYTTQEAIEMEIPVACLNVGAQAEKVSQYNMGCVIDSFNSEIILKEIIKFVHEIYYKK
nr:glycosyltransferase [Clostridium neonatale]